MSIVLELGPEIEAKLKAAADQQGQSVEALLKLWIEERTGHDQPALSREERGRLLREAPAQFSDWDIPVLSHEALRREHLY